MQPDPPTLTPRETQVFVLLAEGLIYPEISARLNVGIDRVKQAARSGRDKFDAATMIEAVVKAERLGMLPLPDDAPVVG